MEYERMVARNIENIIENIKTDNEIYLDYILRCFSNENPYYLFRFSENVQSTKHYIEMSVNSIYYYMINYNKDKYYNFI